MSLADGLSVRRVAGILARVAREFLDRCQPRSDMRWVLVSLDRPTAMGHSMRQRDPKVLARMAQMRAKITVLQEALSGFFTDHHGGFHSEEARLRVRASTGRSSRHGPLGVGDRRSHDRDQQSGPRAEGSVELVGQRAGQSWAPGDLQLAVGVAEMPFHRLDGDE